MDYLAAIDEDIMACKVELLQVQSILQSEAKKKKERKVETALGQIRSKLYLVDLALSRITDTGHLRRMLENEVHPAHFLRKRMLQYVKDLSNITDSQDTVLKDSAYEQFTTTVLTILHAIDVFLFDVYGDASLKAAADNTTALWKTYIQTGNKSTDVLHTTIISIGEIMRKLPKDKCDRAYRYLHAIGKALAKGEPTKYITDDSDPPNSGRNEKDLIDELFTGGTKE